MKRAILLLFVLFSFTSAFAQKQEVELKDGVFTVDGTPVFKFTKTKSQAHYGMSDWYLETLDGKKVAYYRFEQFADPTPNSLTRKTQYFEVTFLETGGKTEVLWYARSERNAKQIYEAGLIKEGVLDEDKAAEFVMINGTPFSKRRAELNGSNQTIIINNPPQQQPKSGVNININTP